MDCYSKIKLDYCILLPLFICHFLKDHLYYYDKIFYNVIIRVLKYIGFHKLKSSKVAMIFLLYVL